MPPLPFPAATPAVSRRLPPAIWVLGFVSLLMDISSEMIHSLLPLFLVSQLGVSVLAVGVLEGAAEATALMVKVFSGAISDYLGKRKLVALLGYASGALTKPVFALATGVGWVVTARMVDRVGKGIRGAPRDALMADITPEHQRGAAFGLRQALDTVGAFVGPLLAVVLMLLWANDYRAVFWVAVLPAVASVLLLWWGVKEPVRDQSRERTWPVSRNNLRRLGAQYWWVVSIGALFTLARFSEAFLVLYAQHVGVATALVPLVMVAMNLVYAACAYPLGALADRVSHERLLVWGLLMLVVGDAALALNTGWLGLSVGVLLWGLHMGMTQGLFAVMVAHAAPADLRGTAYGFFNLVSGVALLLASALAGGLWQYVGPQATFWGGVVLCLFTLGALGWRRARAA